MCGIFAISVVKTKTNQNLAEQIRQGLKRLDYRGYDSWGISVAESKTLHTYKKAGKIDQTQALDLPSSVVGIGHTRWATHGGITDTNAHPHYSSDHSFAVAHNGIVENYQELKQELKQDGYDFITETDTEVIVRLLEKNLAKKSTLLEAARNTVAQIQGRNTFIVLSKSGEIIAARNGSPLVVGLGDDQRSIYISSDTLSFGQLAKKMIVIDNGQVILCKGIDIEIFSKDGQKIQPKIDMVDFVTGSADKEGYPYFMIKEIHESGYVIRQVINQNQKALDELAKATKNAHQVYTIGSGTTGLAAAQTAYYLRQISQINAISLIGAEAQSYYELFAPNDLIIAPSQSGETADVLEVLEFAQKRKLKIASYVNMPGSMMTRMSDFPFLTNAGPEMCVMSTKIFVSQLAWGYLLAKTVAGQYLSGKKNLEKTAQSIERYLENKNTHSTIKQLAHKLISAKDVFLMGKGQNLSIVMEGMVKIIEGAYKHAHGISAGDLKHYAITLMEKGVPVIAVVSNDAVKSDVINSVNEVRARGATVIGISPDKHEGFDEYLYVPETGETSAITNIIPLQLLAYYMTVELGNNVDKPRNIAKSVTVK